jgi:hypothetical protein
MTEHKNNYKAKPEESTEIKIGGCTYIVNSYYREDARENLLDKLWRLIRNDSD